MGMALVGSVIIFLCWIVAESLTGAAKNLALLILMAAWLLVSWVWMGDEIRLVRKYLKSRKKD